MISAIEDDYRGPQLTDGKVTMEFMTQLMQLYREQGKLHKKLAYQILIQIRTYFMSLSSLVDITVPSVISISPLYKNSINILSFVG